MTRIEIKKEDIRYAKESNLDGEVGFYFVVDKSIREVQLHLKQQILDDYEIVTRLKEWLKNNDNHTLYWDLPNHQNYVNDIKKILNGEK